jgi:hypothetical protein
MPPREMSVESGMMDFRQLDAVGNDRLGTTTRHTHAGCRMTIAASNRWPLNFPATRHFRPPNLLPFIENEIAKIGGINCQKNYQFSPCVRPNGRLACWSTGTGEHSCKS